MILCRGVGPSDRFLAGPGGEQDPIMHRRLYTSCPLATNATQQGLNSTEEPVKEWDKFKSGESAESGVRLELMGRELLAEVDAHPLVPLPPPTFPTLPSFNSTHVHPFLLSSSMKLFSNVRFISQHCTSENDLRSVTGPPFGTVDRLRLWLRLA